MKAFSAKEWFLPLIIFALANWSTDQTTVEVGGLKKNRVNFYGTLYTRNSSKPVDVDNISIGGIYRQIPVYEKPNTTQTTLKNDPKKGVRFKLDLSEIKEIRVPHPPKIWHYQRADGARKSDYIEIEVTQNGLDHYLIDTDRNLLCDEVNPAGPKETIVPFNSLDRIIIQGYKQREESKTDKGKNAMEEKKKRCGECSNTKVSQARPDAPCCPECPDDKDCQSPCDHQKLTQRTDCPCGPSCNCTPPCRCPQDSHKCI